MAISAFHFLSLRDMRRCNSQRAVMLLALLVLSIGLYGQADRRKALEKEKVRLLDELEFASQILAETRKDKKVSLEEIQAFQKKIDLRESLLRNLNREIKLLDQEINDQNTKLDSLQADLTKKKEQYAEMIRQARRSQSSHNRLMFLLSAKDFNQALKRLEYMKLYAQFRRRQVALIQERQTEISQTLSELERQKLRKLALGREMNAEKERLTAEKQAQEKRIEEYGAREEALTAEIAAKEKRSQKLEKEIQRLIALEIKRAKAAAERRQLEERAIKTGLVRGRDFSSNTTNDRLESLINKALKAGAEAAKPSTNYALTPEARALAASFEANQNRLPWPVEKGLVIGTFGKQRHPVAKSVIIRNNGIDIATEKGSVARAAFKGEVLKIIRIPGESLAILVQHGNYYTLYKNLAVPYVKQGETIQSGQELGLIYTDITEGKTVLHFEIWKNLQVMDPMMWLVTRG